MDVTVKVRFGASRESFETYGGNKYLLYLPFPEDDDSESIIAGFISRATGTPQKRVFFKTKDSMGNWIFQLG